MPLPWMLGAMIANTVAALSHVPLVAPVSLRLVMVPILGVMLGSAFHPGIFDRLGEWSVAFAALPVFTCLAFALSFFVYRVIGRFDGVTAYFSAAPGGLTDMMLIGGAAGGSERRIGLAHSGRILVVVTFVAIFYATFFDIRAVGDARPYVGLIDVAPVDLLVLGFCAIAGVWIGPKVRLPAPQLVGPMVVSAIVHFAGVTDAPPPSLLVNAAQVVIGTVVGCRFAGAKLQEVAHDLWLSLLSSVGMLAAALATAFAVAAALGVGVDRIFLAFSPGGLPEMSLLALSMGADVAFVATLHIARIVLVISLAPLFFRWWRKS